MSLPPGDTVAVATRERWRTTSLTEVWLRPGDWYHPAVDAVVEAIIEGRSPEAPAHRLGNARSAAGISLDETLEDVACLFRTVGSPVDVDAVRGSALGWALGRERRPALSGVRDPATGLPTADYLGERLRETYGRAERDGVEATESHCLVVVDVAVEALDPWQRMARAASVGRTLDQVFGGGHPMASLSDGVFAVLCERSADIPRLSQGVRRIIERNAQILGVSETMRRPVRVWMERLPRDHEAALDLLEHLRR
ncbi:hypothetical protein [Isoptericola sediminis]|uniref:GGDEF domain-containing protein n=1 Tax=Isoptericola sediminis TaxID=2733572 RepID=A0A849K256_9MICO|nr:hypothetical protein [Isoptericola sediminis]NNU28814.1 hypothetical protein [Isoptericola sediminis]